MRQCTCGYTIFRERQIRTSTEVQRWLMFEDINGGGFGSYPLGALMGGGSTVGTLWGLFDATTQRCAAEVSCTSCQRVRLTRELGSFTYLGSYFSGNYIYVVGADDDGPSQLSLQLVGPATYDLGLSYTVDVQQAVAMEVPDVTTNVEPTENVADTLLRAEIPDVIPGTYSVVLVNSCFGTSTVLGTIDLEASVMILFPRDADLGGAPRFWLQGLRSSPVSQPASGAPASVPFDKLQVLFEYDAELGTLPAAQGWIMSYGAAGGTYAMAAGGAYSVDTNGDVFSMAGNDTGTQIERLMIYARITDLGCTGATSGLSLGCGVVGAAGSFTGGSTVLDSAVYAYSIPLATYLQVDETPAVGWIDHGLVVDTNAAGLAWVGERIIDVPMTVDPGGAPVSGGGLTTFSGATGVFLLKHLVVGDGRWIRAKWTAVTTVVAPTLRFYFVADPGSLPTRTARFRVCYGPASAGPYTRPASTVDFTVNLGATPNVVVEASTALSGLTANTGFYFTLERVYDHVDDVMDATAHLQYVTVRAT